MSVIGYSWNLMLWLQSNIFTFYYHSQNMLWNYNQAIWGSENQAIWLTENYGPDMLQNDQRMKHYSSNAFILSCKK